LFFILGVIFAGLWASASVAAKIGVAYMEPLVLFQIRFFLGAFILLAYSFIFEKWRFPTKSEYKDLVIFGFFNITLYLSLFVVAIKEVAAGIGSLATSMGPLLMSIIGTMVYKQKLKTHQIFGLIFGLIGVWITVVPLLEGKLATPKGLVLLFISMLSYSAASLFYAHREWTLSTYAINGWQLLFGAIFLLPATMYMKQLPIVITSQAVFSILWLVLAVSILSVNIWLRMLKIDPLRASFFLFLCPIFGFIFASKLLNEPFTIYTLVGLLLVLFGLYLGQKRKTI